MKKLFASLLLAASLLLPGTAAFAQTPSEEAPTQESVPFEDILKIVAQLDLFMQAAHDGDTKALEALVSAKNPTLLASLQEVIKDGVEIELDYAGYSPNPEVLSDGRAKALAHFSASSENAGSSWSLSGLETYFIFERAGDTWVITDTDLHKHIGPETAAKVVGIIGLFMAVVFIPMMLLLVVLSIFWIWMFIDCIKRDFDQKVLWIILLVLLTHLGAILYFFLVKRKNVTNTPAAPNTPATTIV